MNLANLGRVRCRDRSSERCSGITFRVTFISSSLSCITVVTSYTPKVRDVILHFNLVKDVHHNIFSQTKKVINHEMKNTVTVGNSCDKCLSTDTFSLIKRMQLSPVLTCGKKATCK